jgi:two-component system CheB/CheR fusion protein
MAGDREQCMEAGCTAYASKPIDKNQLLKTIAEVMANREPTTLASPAECQQV